MTSTTDSSAPADSPGLHPAASHRDQALAGPAGAGSERDELIRQLEETQQAFERRALSAMAEPLISTPLTMQQLKVLAMIAIDPARATGQNLAGLLQVSVASMSGMVDRLVDHGMVRRTEDPVDRRVRRLSVTTEGSEMIRSLLSSAGTLPTPVLHRMALEDLRALVQGIRAADLAAQQFNASGPDPA
ncbi:MAG: MarR family transcriptional regulator [Propionibacteriaceae bacterium]